LDDRRNVRPVDDHADRALLIGAVDPQPWNRCQPGQRLVVRVAEPIAGARRDERQGRVRGSQQRVGGAVPRSMVADLEHVDRPEQPAPKQQGLDG
jgi:hypothetical protein